MEEKTQKEKNLERIMALPLVKDCPDLMDVIIPRSNKIMVMKKSIDAGATRSGLFIPETANSHLPVGVIVALGPDCKEDLRIGQLVWYNMACNMTQWIHGVEYIMMNDIDVYHFYNPDGKVVLLDGNIGTHQKDLKKAEAIAQNTHVMGVIKKDAANAKDKRLEENKKRLQKGIIGRA